MSSDNITADLSQFDNHFASAKVEDRSPDSVPDGKYQVRVERVKLVRSTSKHPMLKWALRVLGPTHKGALIWRNNLISTAENVKWLKQDLYTCGLELNRLSELPNNLGRLLDIALEVTKRRKGEYDNIYFNSRIVLKDEAPGFADTISDDIPF